MRNRAPDRNFGNAEINAIDRSIAPDKLRNDSATLHKRAFFAMISPTHLALNTVIGLNSQAQWAVSQRPIAADISKPTGPIGE